MAYLSLYRKYRSQTFADISGQDHVTRTLQNALRTGRVAHGYLFCGPRGTGKTSTARLLAKALNCVQGPTAEPCNVCDACVQITDGRYLDMKEIDAASNRGIDAFRELCDSVAYAPTQGKYTVYVIDEVHQVTGEAFNAFLKTLEEPPPHVVFILATTEPHKIPATIISRCQRFEFRRASLPQLMERVGWVAQQEGIAIDAAALDLIAREANGGWRDALSLLEQVMAFSEGAITAQEVYQVLGTVQFDTLCALSEAIREADGSGVVWKVVDELITEGKDPRQLLRDLTLHYRSLMLSGAGSAPVGDPAQAAKIAAQARAYGHLRLVSAIETLSQADREARWSEQPRLLLELAVVRLMFPREILAPQSAAPAARPAAPSGAATGARQRPAAPSLSAAPPGPRAPAPPPRTASPSAAPAHAASLAPPGLADEARPAERTAQPHAQSNPQPHAKPNQGSGLFQAPLPPPPLTVGDARAGSDDDDDDLSSFESLLPAESALPEPPPVTQRQAYSPFAAPVSRAAGSEPASGPARASGADAVGGELGQLKRKWAVIVEELARERGLRHMKSFLADTEPDRLEADVLVVRFPFATMAQGFTDKGKTFSDPLCSAIQRVTGVVCRIRAESGGSAKGKSGVSRPGSPNPAGTASPARPPASNSSSAPASSRSQPSAAEKAAPGELAFPARPPAPAGAAAPPAAGTNGGGDLMHDVVEIFDGQILGDHDN